MSENRKQILDMLAQGKVTAEEAERLLAALEQQTAQASGSPTKKPKYLRVVCEAGPTPGPNTGTLPNVNVRVPMQLLRAGVKLASLIPVAARKHIDEALHEHGITMDLSSLTPQNLEELIDSLNEMTVDVDDSGNRVRVFCE